MTGPKGNSEFCLPETLNVLQGEMEANIEVEGKQNYNLLPRVSHLVLPPNSNVEKKCKEIVCLAPAD